ncbi:MAG: ACP S-malonyltransferase [Candidatus Delongbacteria bacterium]|jgi:[acyl-carrier-protein] S-malonyltransferase|nr:ACP S-malonyltransferase [Candidatus Delongbacteria bacterium]
MKAFVFPGQGAQFPGMAKDLYDNYPEAKNRFEEANKILGFNITDIMFDGTPEDLKQTKVTQPAIFLHSVIRVMTMGEDFNPDMVAGHSLGEFSALVANQTLHFNDGLKLVYKRALAMQKACEKERSTMAAILGMDDDKVESICKDIDDIVVPANYNSPGQVVISGSLAGVEKAIEKAKEAGAKRALPLAVGGAFHSPLMESAREELEKAINETDFNKGLCPVYQNMDAKPHTNPDEIRGNLIAQLTSPVRWTQSVQAMIADGADEFVEIGPGKVLCGLIKKIDRKQNVSNLT